MQRNLLLSGCLLGTLAVILGAFGSHMLQNDISPEKMKIFQTGIQYHFYHTFAIFITVILYQFLHLRNILTAGYLFIIGVLLFSGSLYIIAIAEQKSWIVYLTPIGGMMFITGWIVLLLSLFKVKYTK